MSWSKGIAEWIEEDTAFVSVAFSWMLPVAYQRAVWLRSQGYNVRAGGPGTFANKKFLEPVAQLGGDVDALAHHNPDATIASRGCPIGCSFCIVPTMEGRSFTLLPDFTPRPILCDNNLSALPVDYQCFIIEKYQKSGVFIADANSGFEPQSFDQDTFNRWKPVNKGPWRFAYDELKEQDAVHRMSLVLKDVSPFYKRVYTLIGNEPVESCLSRIDQVIQWGCEPYAQPVMALNTLYKRPLVRYDWTLQLLRQVQRWTNRHLWRYFPFSQYKSGV